MSPICAVFLDDSRWASNRRCEGTGDTDPSPSSPHFRSRRGTASPTRKDYLPHGGFFAAHCVSTWGKEGPDACRGLVSEPTADRRGRAAITLLNAGGIEVARRQCRDESLRRRRTASRLSRINTLCPSEKNCDVDFGTLSGFPQAALKEKGPGAVWEAPRPEFAPTRPIILGTTGRSVRRATTSAPIHDM